MVGAAWWRRWDGFPPSADRWRAAAAEVQRRGSWLDRVIADEPPSTGKARDWRRWFVVGSLWPPFTLAALQLANVALVASEPSPDRGDLALPALQLLLCVLWVLPIVVGRSKP